MKGVRKKKGWLILSAALAQTVFVSGCGLIPAEEAGGRIVLVKSDSEAAPDYELAQVTRGDVVLDKTVYCTYAQMREEKLSFGTEGRNVQYVYVDAGDSVKAGDLLAKLAVSDLESRLAQLNNTIEENTMLLRQAQELRDYDLSVAEREYGEGRLTRQQYEERTAQIEEGCRDTLQRYEDALYIDGKYAAQIEEELSGCFIYAGMDGVVSQVRGRLQGSRSVAGAEVITVVDSSQCAFRCEAEGNADYFTPGQEVTFVSGNGQTTYPAVLLSPEEAPDPSYLYFVLKDLDLSLVVGMRVSVVVELDRRDDVLMLPSIVIQRADGKEYVYCEDESGLKMVRYITTGLAGTSRTEIIDGLSEGDIVIKR